MKFCIKPNCSALFGCNSVCVCVHTYTHTYTVYIHNHAQTDTHTHNTETQTHIHTHREAMTNSHMHMLYAYTHIQTHTHTPHPSSSSVDPAQTNEAEKKWGSMRCGWRSKSVKIGRLYTVVLIAVKVLLQYSFSHAHYAQVS